MSGLVHVSQVRFEKTQQGVDPLSPVVFSHATPNVGYVPAVNVTQRKYALIMGPLLFEQAYIDSSQWSFGLKTCKDTEYESGRPINVYVVQPLPFDGAEYISAWARQASCVLSPASIASETVGSTSYVPRKGSAGACDVAYYVSSTAGSGSPSLWSGLAHFSIDDDLEYYYDASENSYVLRLPEAVRRNVGTAAAYWDADIEAWLDAVTGVQLSPSSPECMHFKSIAVMSSDTVLVAGTPFASDLSEATTLPTMAFSGRLRGMDACVFNAKHNARVDMSQVVSSGVRIAPGACEMDPMAGNLGDIITAFVTAMPLRNPAAYASIDKTRLSAARQALGAALAADLAGHLSSNKSISHHLLRFRRDAPRHDTPEEATVQTCYQEGSQVGPVYAELLRPCDPIRVDCELQMDNAWIQRALVPYPDLASCLMLADGVGKLTIVVSCWIGQTPT